MCILQLRLCYVCCDHIHRDGDREQSIWLHILDCLRQRHKALRQAQVVNTAHSDVLVNATDRNEDCDDASEQSTIQQPSHRQTRLGNRLRQEAAQGADVMSQPASDTRSPSPPCLAANDLEDGRFADPPSGIFLWSNTFPYQLVSQIAVTCSREPLIRDFFKKYSEMLIFAPLL